MPSKVCPGCLLEKDFEEYNFKHKAKGTRQIRCRECTRRQVQRHYSQNQTYYVKKARQRVIHLKIMQREKLMAYLSTHPCVDCGESDMVCLDFDHVHGQKIGTISNMIGSYEWSSIEAEIAKCEVRCANCHRRKTAKQFGYWGSKYNVRP